MMPPVGPEMLGPVTTLEGPKRQPVQPERLVPVTIAVGRMRPAPVSSVVGLKRLVLVMRLGEPGRPEPAMTAGELKKLELVSSVA